MSTKYQTSLMNYVNEVAEFFLASFPEVTVLGPDDYTLIAEWEKEEIPLEIIFRSLNDRTVLVGNETPSIVRFHESVEKSFREWLAAKE